jgi:hypothetical protein
VPLDDKGRQLYMEILGCLLYLAVCTRTDASQSVGALSRFMSCPTSAHLEAAKHVLRYIAGTSMFGLCFGNCTDEERELNMSCNSSYADCVDTRRSTAGVAVVFNGAAVSYSSRVQPTVAVSSQEAEYMSAGSAAKTALWCRKILPELDDDGQDAIRISDERRM